MLLDSSNSTKLQRAWSSLSTLGSAPRAYWPDGQQSVLSSCPNISHAPESAHQLGTRWTYSRPSNQAPRLETMLAKNWNFSGTGGRVVHGTPQSSPTDTEAQEERHDD